MNPEEPCPVLWKAIRPAGVCPANKPWPVRKVSPPAFRSCSRIWVCKAPPLRLVRSRWNPPITGEAIANHTPGQTRHQHYDQGCAFGFSGLARCSCAGARRACPAPGRGTARHNKSHARRRLVSIEAGKIFSEGLGEVQEMKIDICDFAVGSLTPALRPDDRQRSAPSIA